VLQYSDGLSNKVSNIIRRHRENTKLLLICILLLSHSFIFFSFYFLSMRIWLYSCLILQFMYFYYYVYVFLLYVYVSPSCHLALFGYPDWGFSVIFSQLWGKCQGKTRKDGARPVLFQNFCVGLCIVCFMSFCVLCVCVNVYCTTATGWLPNCS